MNGIEKYLKVSEMGVESITPEKTLRVTELPKEKTEQECRNERVENNLTSMLTHGFASDDAVTAIRNVLYMDKAIDCLSTYNGWKDVALFLLGKLSASEKERY